MAVTLKRVVIPEVVAALGVPGAGVPPALEAAAAPVVPLPPGEVVTAAAMLAEVAAVVPRGEVTTARETYKAVSLWSR